jgi:hypothetical protein
MKKILLPISLLLGSNAYAQIDGHEGHNHGSKGLYGHAHVLLHADYTNKENQEANSRDVYTHTHAHFGYGFTNNFSVNSKIEFEAQTSGHTHIGDAKVTGRSNMFENQQLIVQELMLNYDLKNYGIYAGKFNPSLNMDYHNVPGVHGYQLIEEYTMFERVGAGGYVKLNLGDFGKHKINTSVFNRDNSALSAVLGREREHLNREDGGIGNTGDLDSYAVSIEGKDFFSLNNNIVEGFAYKVSYATQQAAENNEKDEHRYAISSTYKQKLKQNITAKLFFEFQNIDNLAGEAFHDRSYSTGALGFDINKWNFTGLYSFIRNNAGEEDETLDGEIKQFSVTHQFPKNMSIGFAFEDRAEDGERSQRFGMVFGVKL